MDSKTENIDFVMIWVDDSDEKWRQEKNKYKGGSDVSDGNVDDSAARYKDWQNLKYWFRGVEKFAPWVHKVYFITCGHVPAWLNLDAPKLVHVKHSDYMPDRYLPTFSSHPIELNIHRIEELSEKFVYFNDDMFLIRSVTPDLFFDQGLPVHPARLHGILPRNDGGVMPHIYLNMISALNRHFNFHKCIKKNKKKWFNPFVVGLHDFIDNVYNSNYAQFPGIGNEHLPVPILKETMREVWAKEPELLEKTCMHRFRSEQDVSQYLFRYWQIAQGNFKPINRKKLGEKITILDDNTKILDIIRRQKYPMVCINDMGKTKEEHFDRLKQEFIDAFDSILPDKSSFEK